MSVVGFDFGNESGVVAVARQRGIDVVLNDESKRETPALVCFGDKQRFLGTAGAASSMMNPKNTISQVKRLIGRQFSDPELQRDIKTLPFAVTEGPDGYPLINVRYLGEARTFTPTQVLGMVLSNLKSIAETNLNAAVVDCCIGIPIYFTELQRRAVLDAATIAGLHPLRLLHETTATALYSNVQKEDECEENQIKSTILTSGKCFAKCATSPRFSDTVSVDGEDEEVEDEKENNLTAAILKQNDCEPSKPAHALPIPLPASISSRLLCGSW